MLSPQTLILKAIQAKVEASGLDWLKVKEFRLDAGERRVTATLELAGEADPVMLSARYRINDDNTAEITEVHASRRWMTEALRLALEKTGASFPLPDGWKGKLIRALL